MAFLLQEYFNGTLADWTQLDESDATTSAPGVWTIRAAQNDLQQSSNIFGPNDGLRRPGTFLIYDNGDAWSNYNMSMMLDSTDNDHIGFMVYYQDTDNYIQFRSSSQGNESQLWSNVGGVQTSLASETFAYQVSKWYEFVVTITGNTITVQRDGAELFGGPVAYSGLASGTVALYCSGNQSGFFNMVVVQDNPIDIVGLTSPRIAVVGRPNNKQIGRIF